MGKSSRELMEIINEYNPSEAERYLIDHIPDFFDESRDIQPDSCKLWRENSPVLAGLQAYENQLNAYYTMVHNFQTVKDLRSQFTSDHSNRDEVCSQVDLFRDGNIIERGLIQRLSDPAKVVYKNEAFAGMENNLSHMADSELIEPILPPFRHPAFCSKSNEEYVANEKYVTDVNYMVHDFGNICRKLKKTSKTILIDMGASLQFHAGDGEEKNPALYLPKIYQKFGMKFDHIYAYEIDPKDTNEVYNLLPEEMQASYHWINMGVSNERDSVSNPFNMLLKHYDEDDLVVVKLDIDHMDTERGLIQQLFEDTRLHGLIDHFYFEDTRVFQHVTPKGRPYYWGFDKAIFDIFISLRKLGIAAHAWV